MTDTTKGFLVILGFFLLAFLYGCLVWGPKAYF